MLTNTGVHKFVNVMYELISFQFIQYCSVKCFLICEDAYGLVPGVGLFSYKNKIVPIFSGHILNTPELFYLIKEGSYLLNSCYSRAMYLLLLPLVTFLLVYFGNSVLLVSQCALTHFCRPVHETFDFCVPLFDAFYPS